ncbi:peroxisomal leader peptide-processing protease-like [Cimex lectularius]|uniref:Peroxisomal leader peptide-processing protease n=1 Tax=Cimex lectularius TaxID=79782 RepID=A0A8I6S5W7_CIMLE|nr:peroxisomal leader peptide-processing protease-like [Cimex lectularius]XP_014256384.1 peroxisomal leader peptide-processing protease-like [Cimex lectularius]XP_014256386.1 peroxisomal leader peptide-processing protease-like [Cimex lectularius]
MLGLSAVRVSLKTNNDFKVYWSGVQIADWVFTTAIPLFTNVNEEQMAHLKDIGNKFETCECLKKFNISIIAQEFNNNSSKLKKYTIKGKIKNIWKIYDVEEALKGLLKDPSISLSSANNEACHVSLLDGCYFLIIKLGTLNLLTLDDAVLLLYGASVPTDLIEQGLPITIVSTPFGIKNLFNSWSSGIISNVLDEKNKKVLLTDIRLAPSCEGSPICRVQMSQVKDIVGLVLTPLIIDNNEYSGYSLGVPTVELVNSLCKTIFPYMSFLWLDKELDRLSGKQIEWQTVLTNTGFVESVVVVSDQTSWATGVIVDQGLIITSAHIVNYGNLSNSIVVTTHDSKNFIGDVVFSTSSDNEIDFAVLSFNPTKNSYKKIELASTPPKLGENVLAIGFSILLSPKPNISVGIISNVGKLLTSSCTVQSGMSGGALIRSDGSLLGIIQCNLKADNLYPNINFSVPVTFFGPSLVSYLESRDASCFYKGIEERGKSLPKILGSKL